MELIGHKTLALFDLWSICHFLTGIAIGKIAAKAIHYRWTVSSNALTLVLAVSYGWEVVEYALEAGYAGQQIAYWFQGQEYWLNRLLTDPLLVLSGYLIGGKIQLIVWPARILLIIWLWAFIFIFPHSMIYSQQTIPYH